MLTLANKKLASKPGKTTWKCLRRKCFLFTSNFYGYVSVHQRTEGRQEVIQTRSHTTVDVSLLFSVAQLFETPIVTACQVLQGALCSVLVNTITACRSERKGFWPSDSAVALANKNKDPAICLCGGGQVGRFLKS